jgi:hypothetical protein
MSRVQLAWEVKGFVPPARSFFLPSEGRGLNKGLRTVLARGVRGRACCGIGGTVIAQKAAQVVLAKAAEKMGGTDALAEYLGVRPDGLRQYLEGSLPVSEELYLKAVDIVLGDPDSPPEDPTPAPPDAKRA